MSHITPLALGQSALTALRLGGMTSRSLSMERLLKNPSMEDILLFGPSSKLGL